MTIDELYASISDNVDIDYYLFDNCESLSAPIGDRYVIAIDPTKVKSQADEKVKVAHEYEHCRLWTFYSPTTDYIVRRQCEVKTDRSTIKRLVPLNELKTALASGIREPWELADHFGVPEKFLREAVAFYESLLQDFLC